MLSRVSSVLVRQLGALQLGQLSVGLPIFSLQPFLCGTRCNPGTRCIFFLDFDFVLSRRSSGSIHQLDRPQKASPLGSGCLSTGILSSSWRARRDKLRLSNALSFQDSMCVEGLNYSRRLRRVALHCVLPRPLLIALGACCWLLS